MEVYPPGLTSTGRQIEPPATANGLGGLIRQYVTELMPQSTKGQRDAASALFSKHIREFVADLRSKGRDPKYVTEMEFKLNSLANECGWHQIKDVTADS